jgi:hypothetical protein
MERLPRKPPEAVPSKSPHEGSQTWLQRQGRAMGRAFPRKIGPGALLRPLLGGQRVAFDVILATSEVGGIQQSMGWYGSI